jgi:CheY-like chemotaxis protein
MAETIAVSPATRRTSGHRILIVDDNNDFAASLSVILEGLGNEVRVANDGEAGLEEAQRFIPDIAFLDIGMPRINGYDLATRLRKLPVLAHSVLVAVTGWGQGKDRQQAQAAGFDHHLVKPVESDKIVALLSLAPRGTRG